MNPKIEVRDLRTGEWIWTHKAILFSQYISASDFKVYCGLAAYAGNVDQQSWPSIITLGTKLNLSKSTMIRSMKTLEQSGLIRVDRRDGTSNLYTLLKCEEVRPPAAPKREQSPHHRLVDTFDKASKYFRSVSPVYSPKDMAALKRILAAGILTEEQIEQLIIYYMADPAIKRKFGPSFAVFFSAGIFNGLMNRLRNGETFYKDLDRFATEFYSKQEKPKPVLSPINEKSMEAMKAALTAKLSMKYGGQEMEQVRG